MKIDRYRWTDEEKRNILNTLLSDPAILPEKKEAPRLISMSETISEAISRFRTGKKQLVGVSSGYESLDRLTQGFAPGELIVIFGHTSHGKSQLAQNIACNVAMTGQAVLIISMEMSKAENTGRLMQIFGFTGEQIDMSGKANQFVQLPIIYPDSKEIQADDVDGIVAAAVAEGAKIAIIDHLHYFSRGGDEVAEIGSLVNRFKQIAVQRDIPILLISHIVKLDESIRPKKHHLRGSSYIAQDADMLISVYRDPDNEQWGLQINIHKNRNRGFDPADSGITLAIEDNVRLIELKPLT